MSAARLRRPGDSSTFLRCSSSPSRRVRALRTPSVVVAALFEEGLAVVEGHAACSAGSPEPPSGDGEEHAGALFEGGAGAFDGGGAGFLCLQHQVDVADELVDALVREADAEVVGGDLFELVGLVEDDGGSFGKDAGVGSIRRPAA